MCLLDTNHASKLLCISPLTFLIPYYIFRDTKHKIEKYIRTYIPFLVLSTIFLWYHPIRYSWRHRLDRCIVIFFATLMIVYIIFIKNMHRILYFFYGMVLAFGFYFLYLSNYYSSKDWCCKNHILYHLGFHLFSGLSIWFVFI